MQFFLFSLADYAIFLLRVFYGAVFVVHGLPKMKDLRQNAKNFEGMGFRPGIAWGTIAALLEFFGGIAILVGFFTQIISLAIALEMAVAMAWRIKQGHKFAGGYEFDAALIVIGFALATLPSGLYAFDSMLGPPLIY